MRQANYSAAFNEFGVAIAKEPDNAYWLLYRLTAGATGRRAEPSRSPFPPTIVGRQPLLAFRAGQATEEALLDRANSPSRRAEARFQTGRPCRRRQSARRRRRYWREVVDAGPAGADRVSLPRATNWRASVAVA